MASSRRHVTRVAVQGSPTIFRRELGGALKALRESKRRESQLQESQRRESKFQENKPWTATYVANELRMDPSRLSRFETGARLPTERDINDLCDIYGADGQLRQRLLKLAEWSREQGWWQPLGLPYSDYVGLEAGAAAIRDYGLGVIPGLLQTSDYARATVRATVSSATHAWSVEEVEHRVEGRMARQRLLRSESAPHFEAIIDESVLHRVVGSQPIMQEQLQQLLYLSELPNVALRVILFDAGALPAPNNKFIIVEFKKAEVADVVFVESVAGDYYLDVPDVVETYKRTFRMLEQQAATPDVTRKVIQKLVT